MDALTGTQIITQLGSAGIIAVILIVILRKVWEAFTTKLDKKDEAHERERRDIQIDHLAERTKLETQIQEQNKALIALNKETVSVITDLKIILNSIKDSIRKEQ